MPDVRGCHLPDNLLYDVENNIWYQDQGNGTVKIGMTAVAAAMAGQLVAFTPKKVGRTVKPGKSCATVESGKWVGPAKLATGGEVVAVAVVPLALKQAAEQVRLAHGEQPLASRRPTQVAAGRGHCMDEAMEAQQSQHTQQQHRARDVVRVGDVF